MAKEGEEPLSLEAALRDANAEWATALEALREARRQITTMVDPAGTPRAHEVLREAEQGVARAGEKLANVAGKLAQARRGGA